MQKHPTFKRANYRKKCCDCGKGIWKPWQRCLPCASIFKRIPVVKRLFRKVKKTKSCWLWTGSVTRSGYGYLGIGGRFAKSQGVHRISWTIRNGTIPDGKWILHKCDIKKCVNPKHLYVGTHKDNVLDAVKRKRYLSGERNPSSRLSSKNVEYIRKNYIKGTGRSDPGNRLILQRKFGISLTHIGRILRRERWGHLL